KLGIPVAKRTVQRYLRRGRSPSPRGQTWSTFLPTHPPGNLACGFLPGPDPFFPPLFALLVPQLRSRRVGPPSPSPPPTDGWVAQQLREATPFGVAPRYLVRDNDAKYGPRFEAVATGTGVAVLRTPIKAPRANAICERLLGSVRRECLDHTLILGEAHLRRALTEYVRYFNRARPHQDIGQRLPQAGPGRSASGRGGISALPILRGLHHDYRRIA